MDFATSIILRRIGAESIDVIAGGETAGIPFAAWIADRLMLPMQYVRKNPKGFGLNAQIEGVVRKGDRILLVEDLTTDGRSKIHFCDALRNAGAETAHTFVVFHYDIFSETRSLLSEHGLSMYWLATWWDVLKAARKSQYLDSAALDVVEEFLHHPTEWSAAHGGESSFRTSATA